MQWFLYIILTTSAAGSQDHVRRTPMPDKATCLEVLEKSRISVPNGNESEGGYAMYCGTGDQSYYGGDWWKRKVK